MSPNDNTFLHDIVNSTSFTGSALAFITLLSPIIAILATLYLSEMAWRHKMSSIIPFVFELKNNGTSTNKNISSNVNGIVVFNDINGSSCINVNYSLSIFSIDNIATNPNNIKYIIYINKYKEYAWTYNSGLKAYIYYIVVEIKDAYSRRILSRSNRIYGSDPSEKVVISVKTRERKSGSEHGSTPIGKALNDIKKYLEKKGLRKKVTYSMIFGNDTKEPSVWCAG